MARPGWYNDNRGRAYPFITGTAGVGTPDSGIPTMRQLPDEWIVDCGFIMGPDSDFEVGTHKVWLRRVYRKGDTVSFEFECDAPQLKGIYLVFNRDVDEDDYANEFVDGEVFFDESESHSLPDSCSEPLWSGYMISGVMSSIAARLGDEDSIEAEEDDATVEPALIQNLNNTIVNSVELANNDRTRATAPSGCPDLVWPHETNVIFVHARCIQGDIRWMPGYNATIQQNSQDNSITISARVGAGEGQPCEEAPLFDQEVPPIGSENNLLSGGPLCNEALRSFNGAGGPAFTLLGGQGVSIIPDPENHCVKVDFNLIDMASCISDFSEVSESV